VPTIVETWSKNAAFEVQAYVELVAAAFRGMFTRPLYRHDIIEQFDAIGVASLTVVLLTGFFTGAVLALQSGLTLDQFGARPVVGRLVSASMVKELGPVLTGLMLTGRIGSGIAAELGSMVVTDQINALRALGTDPIRKVLGFVIVTSACHVGLRTSGGTQGVGRATTVAVVAGSVGVIAVDFFVTRVLISLLY
jgi:phospholipid/cholesterol/gamma-HCH transport system permease protein